MRDNYGARFSYELRQSSKVLFGKKLTLKYTEIFKIVEKVFLKVLYSFQNLYFP